jgi:ATP-dependent DNA ligase
MSTAHILAESKGAADFVTTLLQEVRSTARFAASSPTHAGIVLNDVFEGDGDILFAHACKLGCEGIVSKRLGSPYRSGRSKHWLKIKNPAAPAVKREAEEDWGDKSRRRR